MKILFTSHRFLPEIGGIEVISEMLASYFAEAGHEVRLVTQTPLRKSSGSDNPFPYRVYRQPPISQLIRLHLWADIIYQNNIELQTLWPAFLLRNPIVISIHTWICDSYGKQRFVDRLKRLVLRHVNGVIAVSEAVRRDTFLGSQVIGNPYRNELFYHRPAVSRQYAIAFCGRLVSDKGADLLISAFQRLLLDPQVLDCLDEQGIRLRLTIIGDGPERAALERLANHLNVVPHVCFTGTLEGESLAVALNSHQILAIPSRWAEPFGVVALEGTACGCVPLGSNAGGLPDAIGPAGLLFDRNDPDDLVDKLKLLLLSPALRESMRLQAAPHLQAHRTEAVLASYLEVLESC